MNKDILYALEIICSNFENILQIATDFKKIFTVFLSSYLSLIYISYSTQISA